MERIYVSRGSGADDVVNCNSGRHFDFMRLADSGHACVIRCLSSTKMNSTQVFKLPIS